MEDITGQVPKPGDYLVYFHQRESRFGLSIGKVDAIKPKTLSIQTRRQVKYKSFGTMQFSGSKITFSDKVARTTIGHFANYVILKSGEPQSQNEIGKDSLGNQVFEDDIMCCGVAKYNGKFPILGIGLMQVKGFNKNCPFGKYHLIRMKKQTYPVSFNCKTPYIPIQDEYFADENQKHLIGTHGPYLNTTTPNRGLLLNKITGFFNGC